MAKQEVFEGDVDAMKHNETKFDELKDSEARSVGSV